MKLATAFGSFDDTWNMTEKAENGGLKISPAGLAILLFFCGQAIVGIGVVVGAVWWASAINTKMDSTMQLLTSQGQETGQRFDKIEKRLDVDEQDWKKIRDMKLVQFGERSTH